MKYPYPAGPIRLRNAISLIVTAVYSSDDPKAAEKRVWERIKYTGRKNGWTNKNQFVEAAEFFAWAGRSRGWGALINVEALPLAVNAGGSIITARVFLVDGDAFQTPDDPMELRIAHDRCQQELLALKRENAKLKARLAECDKELNEGRAHEAESRRKKSEAGKRGRGADRSNPYRNR